MEKTWKTQVEEESVTVDERREDGLCQSMWSVGVYHNATRSR